MAGWWRGDTHRPLVIRQSARPPSDVSWNNFFYNKVNSRQKMKTVSIKSPPPPLPSRTPKCSTIVKSQERHVLWYRFKSADLISQTVTVELLWWIERDVFESWTGYGIGFSVTLKGMFCYLTTCSWISFLQIPYFSSWNTKKIVQTQ